VSHDCPHDFGCHPRRQDHKIAGPQDCRRRAQRYVGARQPPYRVQGCARRRAYTAPNPGVGSRATGSRLIAR
jgi:hypothetical protein